MRVKSRSRRNIVVVSVLFLLVGGLVVLAQLSPGSNIPGETAEMAARRANRETNGFYLLEEILTTMPDAPEPAWLPMPDEPGTEAYYQAPPGTLGYRVGVGRLDDDPVLLDYVALGEPLAARVREVLAKADMLPPPRASDPAHKRFGEAFEDGRYYKKLQNLLNLLVAHAYELSGRPETSGESARVLRDVSDLMLRMRDGGVSDRGRVIDGVFFETLTRLQPQEQREMIDWALPLRRLTVPRQRVEYDLREHMALLNSLKKEGSILHPLEAAVYLRHRASYLRHLDACYEAATLRWPEWMQRVRTNRFYRNLFAYGFTPSVYASHNSQWQYRLDFCVLVLALELYRQDHGGFPQALGQLAPNYVPEPPDDVFLERGTPYRYEVHETGYLIGSSKSKDDYYDFERKGRVGEGH